MEQSVPLFVKIMTKMTRCLTTFWRDYCENRERI